MSQQLDPTLILQALQNTLSPDHNTRYEAEQLLVQYSNHPHYAVALAQITVTQNRSIHFSLRQLAGVLLRRYIQENWEKVSGEDKKIIRDNIPIGLTDPNSKITTAVSMIMGEIASFDFPEEWPNLVTNLLHMFDKSDPKSVTASSSLKCLLMVSEHFHSAQIQQVFPNLVPYLMRVSVDDRYSPLTRGRALNIVNVLIELLAMLLGAFEEGTRSLLCPVLNPTLKIVTTNINSSAHTIIKLQSIKIIMTLVKRFPREIKTNISGYIWDGLVRNYPLYVQNIVEGTEEEEYDEEGDSVSFVTLIIQQLELASTLIASKTHSKYFTKVNNLTDVIIGYMQLTTSDMNMFQDDPNQFISVEENVSVRESCLAVLSTITQFFGNNGIQMLLKSVGVCLVESENRMERNEKNWWKLREAALLALTILESDLCEKRIPFDSEALIRSLFSLDLNSSATNVYLQSRAIHLVSLLYQIAPQQLIVQFSQMLALILAPNSSAPTGLKLYACLAVGRLVEGNKIDPNVVNTIVAGVCLLSAETNDDTAHIVLEALAALINSKPEAIHGAEKDVVAILLQLIDRFNNDPVIPSDVINVFEKIARSDSYTALHSLLIPCLPQQLSSVQTMKRLQIVQIMIELTTVLVRFSRNDQEKTALLNSCYIPIASLIIDNDDPELLQNGAECLRGFIYSCGKLLVSHKLPNSMNALQLLLNVIEKLLQPDLNESSSMYVGDLISLLFTKVGSALDSNTIQNILIATIRKLSNSNNLTLIQSIVFLYAKLFLSLFDQTIAFLINHPTEAVINKQTRKMSSLELLLTRWSECQQSFFGAYRLKVTTLGLIKLLQSGHKSLDTIRVSIEAPPKLNEGIRTRSKGSPPQQVIPFIVHAFILIIDSYNRLIESNITSQKDLHALMYGYTGSDDEDEIDDEAETDDEEDEYASDEDNNLDELRNLVSNNQEDDEEEDDIDDPFIKDDPLNQIDLLQVVPIVIREAVGKYGQQLLNGVRPYMTEKQIKSLEQMLK